MTKDVEINLGQQGLDFLQTELKEWGNGVIIGCTLGSGLIGEAAKIDIQNGRVMTLLPDTISLEHVFDFDCGGLDSGRATDWAIEHLENHAKQNKNSALIVQSWCYSPSDPCEEETQERMFFHDNKIYYFLNAEDFNDDTLWDILLDTEYPGGFAFLVGQTIDSNAVQKKAVDLSFIKELASKIIEIYLTVYDDEGILRWSR